MEAHRKNETWSIVPRVPGGRTIDSKWVFKAIQDPGGGIRRFKARLCARGFKQKEGEDYHETFSPVVRYDSLRVLLAIVTKKDYEMFQFDVRTAFLYGELQEKVYMEIPEGLSIKKKDLSAGHNVVCKLRKSLYGLKQAPLCWNYKFSVFLKRFNLKETNADKCVFFGEFEGSEVYLALFVDDGIIAAKSLKVVESIKKFVK